MLGVCYVHGCGGMRYYLVAGLVCCGVVDCLLKWFCVCLEVVVCFAMVLGFVRCVGFVCL